MIVTTTEGTVLVWPTSKSLNRVVLASKDVETLKGVTASLQLRGVSEDAVDVIGDKIDQYVEQDGYWILELDRTTFKLWLDFEAEHYLRGYGKGEMSQAARTPEIFEQIQRIEMEILNENTD